MYFLKRIPRWCRWIAIVMIFLGLGVSAVIASRKTNNIYACLQTTDGQYITRTIDTNTGKVFTSSLFPLRSYDSLAAYWPSPDKSKVAFYWISGNYVRLMSTLDLHTLAKQSSTFNVTDDQILFDGWSADSKYFAVTEKRDNGAEILTVFDAVTMLRVLSKAATGGVWSSQGHQIAYLDADGDSLNGVIIAALDHDAEQTFSILGTVTGDQTKVGNTWLLWSPTNQYLALSNNSQLWVYDTAKASLDKVTGYITLFGGYQGLDRMIRWSTAGNTLLYIESHQLEENHLVAFDQVNKQVRLLATITSDFISFSPDLSAALIADGNGSAQANYSILDLETGRETSLAKNKQWPTPTDVIWFSGSDTVLMTFSDGAFWTKRDGSEQHEIKGLVGFHRMLTGGKWMGYTTDHAGSYYAGLINLATGDYHTFKEGYSDLFNEILSPDGGMAALLFAQQPGQRFVRMKLISADDTWSTTFETTSGNLGRLAWSPDSSKLALYTYTVKGPTTLHVLRSDGTEQRQIDNLPANLYLDRWTNCG